jgi:hypothetical protein
MRTDNLRFGAIEANHLLNDVLGLDLGHEDIQLLQRRTEGWAAGLPTQLWRREIDARVYVSQSREDPPALPYQGSGIEDRSAAVSRARELDLL